MTTGHDESRVRALQALAHQGELLQAVTEVTVGQLLDQLPDADVLRAVLALAAQERCARDVLARFGERRVDPLLDVEGALRAAAAQFASTIDSILAEGIAGDEEAYNEEIAILSGSTAHGGSR